MSQFSCPIAAILVAGSLGVVKLSAQQPREVVVGTLTEDRDGWSLLRLRGSEVAEFMTTQFGPTGVVQDRVLTIRGISAITPDTLADIDVLHLVFDSQGGHVPTLAVDEIAALEQEVQRGLTLLVFVGLSGANPANELLATFGITVQGGSGAGEALPTDAMPNGIRHGPFGTIENVRWGSNSHNHLQVSDTSSATAIVSGGNFNEVVLWSVPGQKMLVFADYFNSYTSVVSGGASSSGFDVLLGNAVSFISSFDCNHNRIHDDADVENGTSNDCNANRVPDECEDCNHNDLADECDLREGVSQDCNTNGVPDECDIAGVVFADCNLNGVPDECDVAAGISDDCNANQVPDECEPDCNSNGIADRCDILSGTSNDCNANRVPDECDLANATSQDCNDTGIPDDCEIDSGRSQDRNMNGVPDRCDLRNGPLQDCNMDGIPDEFEMAEGRGDCNATGTLDECDLADGRANDCNGNGVPDACEIDDHSTNDCNVNGVPDECEPDCDGNDVPDECDLTSYSFGSDGNPARIPAEGTFGTTLATIHIPVSMIVQDIHVELDLTHSFDRDLAATLTSPAATVVTLFHGTGGSGADFRGTILDDEATTPIHMGRAPFQGSFRPRVPLARFLGENAFGTWTLKIVDDGAGDTGMLNRWAVVFPAVSTDCDGDGQPDECGSATAISRDCNGNAVPDECEPDCNSNGIPDDCDVRDGVAADCNSNGVPDGCEIAIDQSVDFNRDGVPDECGVPGDFDGDRDVDLADFIAFGECFRGAERAFLFTECQAFDFDGDGNIDLADFVAMQAAFTRVR